MAWLVVSDDNESGPAIRANAQIMDAHWQYELANRHIILAAGSLRDDDGVTKIGSLLVLDVPTRAEAVTATSSRDRHQFTVASSPSRNLYRG